MPAESPTPAESPAPNQVAISNQAATGLDSSLKQDQLQSASQQRQASRAGSNIGFLGALVIFLSVVGFGTYFGLQYFFGSGGGVQTYQQCVSAGGAVSTAAVPNTCTTSDGIVFTAPAGDGSEAGLSNEPGSDRERAQEAANAQGKELFFQDEVGFNITTPLDWTGVVLATSSLATVAAEVEQDIQEALVLRAPTASEARGVDTITVSFPVALDGPLVRRAKIYENGLAGIPTHPAFTSISSDYFQVSEVTETQFLGFPALEVLLQYSNQAESLPEYGVCAGCWLKSIYFQRDNAITEILIKWGPDNESFEQEAQEVLNTIQFN